MARGSGDSSRAMDRRDRSHGFGNPSRAMDCFGQCLGFENPSRMMDRRSQSWMWRWILKSSEPKEAIDCHMAGAECGDGSSSGWSHGFENRAGWWITMARAMGSKTRVGYGSSWSEPNMVMDHPVTGAMGSKIQVWWWITMAITKCDDISSSDRSHGFENLSRVTDHHGWSCGFGNPGRVTDHHGQSRIWRRIIEWPEPWVWKPK